MLDFRMRTNALWRHEVVNRYLKECPCLLGCVYMDAYSRSSLLCWGWLLWTLASESPSAFSAFWTWLRLDHKTLLQQKVAPSLKSVDSLGSSRVCEQLEMPPDFPSIHFAEYLGTGESNCGSNFLSVWCLKLKSWCWDGFELSESESKSLFCAYCMIQLIFLLKIFFTSA